MNIKMRVFPKEMLDYEKVYTHADSYRLFSLSSMKKPDKFENLNEYIKALRIFIFKKSSNYWMDLVEAHWMFSSYKYHPPRYKIAKNYKRMLTSFNLFMRRNVGTGYYFFTNSIFFRRIPSYIDEIFPDFFNDNPFTNPEKYSYPFKNIDMDYLLVVHQLPERLDILKYADENKLPFDEFLDFVINYIGKSNEVLGVDAYCFYRNKFGRPPYVACLIKKYGYGREKIN
jgi:hypothetical protein